MDKFTVSGDALLYGRVQPLSPDLHGNLAVRTGPDRFAVARRIPLLPLVVGEFATFADIAPIVFVGRHLRPMLVCSTEQARNRLIDSEGRWRASLPLPGYLRRLPFIFAAEEGADDSILCIDESSPLVAPVEAPDSEALFAGEALSAFTFDAANFCGAYAVQEAATRTFVEQLRALDLLRPMRANSSAADGSNILLLTHAVIDGEHLDRLAGEARSWAEAELRSLSRWGALPAL